MKAEAQITALRLVGIEFDSNTLRVVAEADGTARAQVMRLPYGRRLRQLQRASPSRPVYSRAALTPRARRLTLGLFRGVFPRRGAEMPLDAATL